MLNVSETSMAALIPDKLSELVRSARHHLRRVYPSIFRLDSSNLCPLQMWHTGTQLACLNWQYYDEGMQLNEALFAGTMGYVLKPCLEKPQGKPSRLTGEIFGVSSCKYPPMDQSIYI